MAIHKSYNPNTAIVNPWAGATITASNTSFTEKQYAIQGKMLIATHTFTDFEWTQRMLTPEAVKKMLVEQLVEEMYKNGNIEFTKMQDASSFDHKFHARIYVVPDTQVRILRENKVATTGPW